MTQSKVNWLDVPQELREALLNTVRQVTYDLATDGCNYDKRSIVEDIMSTFVAVGDIVFDVKEAQLEAIKDAARDCRVKTEDYVPVTDFEVF